MVPWEDMSPADVRALRQAAGDRPYTIAVGGTGRREDWDAEREHIAAVSEAGADWWIEWVRPGERGAMVEAVERGPLEIREPFRRFETRRPQSRPSRRFARALSARSSRGSCGRSPARAGERPTGDRSSVVCASLTSVAS